MSHALASINVVIPSNSTFPTHKPTNAVYSSAERMEQLAQEPSQNTQRRSLLLVLIATILACIPFWSTARLPFMDAPEHLLTAYMTVHFRDPSLAYEQFFTQNPAQITPILNGWILEGLFTITTNASLVLRLQLTLWSLLLSAALTYAVTFREKTHASFAVIPLLGVHGIALSMGFLDYLMSLPFGIFALGVVLRGPTALHSRGIFLATVAMTLSVLAHPFTTAALLPAFVLLAWSTRSLFRGIFPVIPAVLLAAKTFLSRVHSSSPVTQQTLWDSASEGLETLLLDGFRGIVNTGYIGLAGTLLALFVAWRFSTQEPLSTETSRLRVSLLILAVLYGLCAAFLPGAALNWALLQHRFIPLWWLLLVLVVATKSNTKPLFPGALALVALTAQGAFCFAGYRRVGAELEDYLSGTAAVPLGSRLLPLDFSPQIGSAHRLVRPLHHAWAYVNIERGGMSPYVFATQEYHRIQLRPYPNPPPAFLDRSYSCVRHGITPRTPACDAFRSQRLEAFASRAEGYNALLVHRAPSSFAGVLAAHGFRRVHASASTAVFLR